MPHATLLCASLAFALVALGCGGRQQGEPTVPQARTCPEASACDEGEQCRDGHCLPEVCESTIECPYGFRCSSGQCEEAECYSPNPHIPDAQGHPCPEDYTCEYEDAISSRHGDGRCAER